MADVDLLVVQQHAIDSLDGSVSGLGGLVVDETVTLGSALLISSDLARKDVSESGKGIVQGLVVDGLVKVFDEDVALAGLAKGGITLGPHDTAGTSLNERVVERLQSTLTY